MAGLVSDNVVIGEAARETICGFSPLSDCREWPIDFKVAEVASDIWRRNVMLDDGPKIETLCLQDP